MWTLPHQTIDSVPNTRNHLAYYQSKAVNKVTNSSSVIVGMKNHRGTVTSRWQGRHK